VIVSFRPRWGGLEHLLGIGEVAHLQRRTAHAEGKGSRTVDDSVAAGLMPPPLYRYLTNRR
jgi:hypothetical protein